MCWLAHLERKVLSFQPRIDTWFDIEGSNRVFPSTFFYEYFTTSVKVSLKIVEKAIVSYTRLEVERWPKIGLKQFLKISSEFCSSTGEILNTT